ncbi:MAG: hypothetical protein ACOYMG_01300 [Candidatus Methylumidiphilus sp.]
MWGFIFGLAAGTAVLSNKPKVRRGLAVLLVAGEDAVACAGHTVRRVGTQIREDLEDIMAEARGPEDRY